MHRKMTLALVQTPVDLGYTAAHGHLLAIVPPPPPSQHHPSTNTLSPCLRHRYQEQPRSQHHHPHNEQPFHQQQHQCNGFIKVPCSCSAGIGGNIASTDDESSIPTPPPAVSVYPRDCPIHYVPERSPYVTVHSPASGSYPPLSSIRRHQHYTKQKSQDREMPDITAFSRMLVDQRRQFSTDSETSGYKVSVNNPAATSRQSEPQTTICYQCHGSGHVAVAMPVVSDSVRHMPPYGSLPRDITASTMCSTVADSPEDEEDISQHQRRRTDEDIHFQPRHQRSHSSGTNYYGSLRRITAV